MTQLNATTRYALLAALDLAEHYSPDKPVKLQEMAMRTGAPAQYLVHVLLRLKRRALINSVRGSKGGYWLLRRPAMISAAEVVAAVDDGRRRAHPAPPHGPYDEAIDRLWDTVDRAQWDALSQVSLADLLRTARET